MKTKLDIIQNYQLIDLYHFAKHLNEIHKPRFQNLSNTAKFNSTYPNI